MTKSFIQAQNPASDRISDKFINPADQVPDADYSKDRQLNTNTSTNSANSVMKAKSDNKTPILLSIDKAAKISGLGRNNLAYLIKYHKLPVVKLPGYNRIKIHYDDLMNFIENNKCIYSIGGIKHSRKSASGKS